MIAGYILSCVYRVNAGYILVAGDHRLHSELPVGSGWSLVTFWAVGSGWSPPCNDLSTRGSSSRPASPRAPPSDQAVPTWNQNKVTFTVCGSKILSCHTGRQEARRCPTKGESEESIAHRWQRCQPSDPTWPRNPGETSQEVQYGYQSSTESTDCPPNILKSHVQETSKLLKITRKIFNWAVISYSRLFKGSFILERKQKYFFFDLCRSLM